MIFERFQSVPPFTNRFHVELKVGIRICLQEVRYLKTSSPAFSRWKRELFEAEVK
jgi:hypothetical protein